MVGLGACSAEARKPLFKKPGLIVRACLSSVCPVWVFHSVRVDRATGFGLPNVAITLRYDERRGARPLTTTRLDAVHEPLRDVGAKTRALKGCQLGELRLVCYVNWSNAARLAAAFAKLLTRHLFRTYIADRYGTWLHIAL